jgi:hypothetical protein
MTKDLDEALTEISAIRSQMARTTVFRGYGPATVAATGLLAVVTAVLQAAWIDRPALHVTAYVTLWATAAALCATLVAVEMVARTRRVHGDLAQEMLFAALEQFVPAAVTGGLLTLMLPTVDASAAWLLPALWQLFVALGVFASCRFLPPPIYWVGTWYLVAGFATLVVGRGEFAFSPVAMGGSFGVGQLLTTAILYRHREEADADG